LIRILEHLDLSRTLSQFKCGQEQIEERRKIRKQLFPTSQKILELASAEEEMQGVPYI